MNITVTLIAQMAAFMLLIWFVNKVMWKPMTEMMEARQKRIADGLAAAEQGNQAKLDAEAAAQESINAAKTQAETIIAQAQKRAKDIEAESKVSAEAEAGRIKVAAHAEMETEINQAKEALRVQVASIAVAGAEKVLKAEIDAKKHGALMKDLAAQI